MAQWGILIVQLADSSVAFQPDLPQAQPGQPLGVNNGDLVIWNNRTDKDHWPVADADADVVPAVPKGYLTENIPAGQASSPAFRPAAAGTISYHCKYHTDEKGSIVVS
jgi:plastocyanin